jgi:hypothetical protein
VAVARNGPDESQEVDQTPAPHVAQEEFIPTALRRKKLENLFDIPRNLAFSHCRGGCLGNLNACHVGTPGRVEMHGKAWASNVASVKK